MLHLLLALSTIYSPSPRDYLTVNTTRVDSAVASYNTYGSPDFTATNYLTQAAFTAYLAMWSRYAEQNTHNAIYAQDNIKVIVTDPYLRRAYPVEIVETNTWRWGQEVIYVTNSLKYSFMVDEITNQYISGTSSYFDTLYQYPPLIYGDTIDITNLIPYFATFSDLPRSLFHVESPQDSPIYTLADHLNFGEYRPNASTLPDVLAAYYDAPIKIPTNFENYCVHAFGNTNIYFITNNTPYLSLRPLHAFGQAISMQDADSCYAAGSAQYTNKLKRSYSLNATAKSDTITVIVKSDGTVGWNLPSRVTTEEFYETISTNIENTACFYPPSIRVSACNATASLFGETNICRLTAAVNTSNLLYNVGYTSTNPVTVVINTQLSESSGVVEFYVVFSVPGYGSQWTAVYTNFSCFAGNYGVDTKATVHSSYHISETTESSGQYATNRWVSYLSPYHFRMYGTGWSYGICGIASNTNPPAFGTTIDFGYDGKSAKPSASVDRADWVYFSDNIVAHNKRTYSGRLVDLQKSLMRSAYPIMVNYAKDAAGGNFYDATTWLGCGNERGIAATIDDFFAEIGDYGESTVTQIVTFVSGVPSPETIEVYGALTARVSGSRSAGPYNLHPSAGADANAAIYSKANHQPSSIRRRDN